MPIIPPYRPDQGELISGTVSNVMMGQAGWGPDKALTPVAGAEALPAAPRGYASCILPDGTFKVFVSTATEVYELATDGTWTALSASLSTPDGEDNIMKQFGVFLILTNTVDGMLAYNIVTPAGWNAISEAPAARGLFPTNNLLVAYDCDGENRRYQTSNRGNYTDWSTGTALADDLENGGALTGGWDLGNGRAILCQQDAVNVMTFGDAGGGARFRVDVMGEGVGAVHPRSVRGFNGRVMMLHQTGFLMASAQGIENIGAEKVNRTFASLCDDFTKVYIEVDPRNTRYRIRYKSVNNASETVYSDYLDYNWVLNEFIPGSQETQAIFRIASPGYTLEGLDAIDDLDALTFSLDSAAWKGEQPALGGLDVDGKAGFFDGDNLEASLETATVVSPTNDLISSVTPVTDDAAATVQIGVADRQQDALIWKDAVAIEDSGRARIRGRGKKRRLRINHLAGSTWSLTQGFSDDMEISAGGAR